MAFESIGTSSNRRRGVSLVAVSMLITGVAVMSLALVTMVESSQSAERGTRNQTNARYVAEAGLSVAMMRLSNGVDIEELDLGTKDEPVEYGSANYWIEAKDVGGSLFELTSTGVENQVGSQIELVVRAVSQDTTAWAAFGDEGLTVNGSTLVDSYDSRLGTYEEQATNGNPSNAHARSNGHVGSNANISARASSTVHGNATPGPEGTVSITGHASVSGSTVPAADLIGLAPVEVPEAPSVGDMVFDGSGSGAFGAYIPAGTYHLGDVEVDVASLTIVGPATLVFDSLQVRSNSEVWIDASGGPVEIFVLGDFELASNSLMAATDYDPSNLSINLLANNSDEEEDEDDDHDGDHDDDDDHDGDHDDDDDDHDGDHDDDDDDHDGDHDDDDDDHDGDHDDDDDDHDGDHDDDDDDHDGDHDDDDDDHDGDDGDDGEDDDTIEFASNSQLYGTVYAPSAFVTIDANFQLYGSLIALRVSIESHGRIHFDEALMDGNLDSTITYEVVGWRHTPYQD